MRRLAWILALALWSLARPALAVYPAPWPDTGSADVTTGWTVYTAGGLELRDKEGATDDSTGGTTPQQEADVSSDGLTRPSMYYGFDEANQVAFFRFRLARQPMRANPPTGGNAQDPLNPVGWNVLIDTDGDGYKEFIIGLNGDSGAPASPGDNLDVWYEDISSQAFPVGSPNWTVKAGVYPESDARADVIDLGNVRSVAPALTGGGDGFFLDLQVPMSVFNVGGTQLIDGDTIIAMTYGTANSNTNPFQKDAVCAGAITATTPLPICMGDLFTLRGGNIQDPYILDVTGACSRPNDLLQAEVRDYLRVVGGVIEPSVVSVSFYYQPDSDGDGTPDVGSSPTLIGTVTTPSAGTVDRFEFDWDTSLAPVGGTYTLFARAVDDQANQADSGAVTCTFSPLPGVLVSGVVYLDSNHDGTRQPAEAGPGVAGFYVKLLLGGVVEGSVAVDPSTGAWSFGAVSPGSYELQVDDNNDPMDNVASYLAGFIGTERPTGARALTVASTAISDLLFGVWHGSLLSGQVFRDDGAGGTVEANNGIQDPGEPGLGNVLVRLLSGATLLEETLTDGLGAYRLFVPASADGETLAVEEVNPNGHLSVTGEPGDTGGAYDLAADQVTFLYDLAMAFFTGVDFGDVAAHQLFGDNQREGGPGEIVTHPHTFIAGTAGSLSFTETRLSTPNLPNWASALYLDADADGVVGPGEALVTGPLSTVAGQVFSFVLKHYIPPNAPLGAQELLTLTASFLPQPNHPAVPVVATELARQDLTTVRATAGVTLRKAVDRASAQPGDTLTYTITYLNPGKEAITKLVVADRTPVYTTFLAASSGPLPDGLTGVSLTDPGVGSAGAVEWTFSGELRPGAEGTVTFQVLVE